MRSYLASVTLVLASHGTVVAQTPADDAATSIAEAYLAAYSTFDVSKMAPFYADDAVFSDPTSVGQIPGYDAFFFNGKDAIIKGLGDYAATYNRFSLNYDLMRRYESAGVVVFVANLTYQGETKDGQQFSGGSPIVTVVEVKGGKVTRHSDYFDYKQNAVEFSK
jgi:ketosteroid isomerase-like protein